MPANPYTMELMDASDSPLAWYYDWVGDLAEDGQGGLCLLCPSCGSERELLRQAAYAGPCDTASYSDCNICGGKA